MKNKLLLLGLVASTMFVISCGDDDAPAAENEEEVIDLVTLTFTPAQGNPVVVTATDPDGEGPEDLAPDAAIALNANTTYTLTLKLENSEEGENITEEIEEEDDEHMFFFGFTADFFSDPAGNGNVDARADDVNYNDTDGTNPVGLSTSWTTGSSAATGTFNVILKHQPDGIKSATSGSGDGESDIDLTWDISTSIPDGRN